MIKKWLVPVGTVMVLIFLSLVVGAQDAPIDVQVLDGLNAYRVENGLEAFTQSATLNTLAADFIATVGNDCSYSRQPRKGDYPGEIEFIYQCGSVTPAAAVGVLRQNRAVLNADYPALGYAYQQLPNRLDVFVAIYGTVVDVPATGGGAAPAGDPGVPASTPLGPTPTFAPVMSLDTDPSELLIFNELNAQRINRGLPEFVWNPLLAQIGQDFAATVANNCGYPQDPEPGVFPGEIFLLYNCTVRADADQQTADTFKTSSAIAQARFTSMGVYVRPGDGGSRPTLYIAILGTSDATRAQTPLEMINDIRLGDGLPALALSPSLNEIAVAFAETVNRDCSYGRSPEKGTYPGNIVLVYDCGLTKEISEAITGFRNQAALKSGQYLAVGVDFVQRQGGPNVFVVILGTEIDAVIEDTTSEEVFVDVATVARTADLPTDTTSTPLNIPGDLTALADTAEQTVSGTLNTETPFVEIPVEVTEENITLTAAMQSSSGDLDPYMYLLDANSNVLEENDDRVEGDYTSSMVSYENIPPGSYTVIATRYNVTTGETTGDFTAWVDQTQPEIPALDYAVTDEALSAAGYPVQEPQAETEWTILAYYGGDNNLEGDLINDLNEFELAGGSDSSVRIILLMDRSPGHSDAAGNWEGVKLFEVSNNATVDDPSVYPPTVDTVEIADLGELNTSAGVNLAQFLVWGIQHYPAQHYAVAFGSHGAGWEGLVTDDTSNHDILSLSELRQAFEVAQVEAGIDRFEVLINDACLMSSVEYHAAMSDYFTISYASPEIVVNPALNMTDFTNAIRVNPDDNLELLGTALVERYIQQDITLKNFNGQEFLTHSVTDLTKFDPVMLATEAFAEYINREPSAYYNLIGTARANSYTYTSFIGTTTRIDLGNFMEQIILLSDDAEVNRLASEVIRALETARIHGNAGRRALSETSYQNIYFPDKFADFKLSYMYESPLPQWGNMLRNFYSISTPTPWNVADNSILRYHPPVTPQVKVTQIFPETASAEVPPTIMMEVEGRNFSHGVFTIDQVQPDGTALRLSAINMVTEVAVGNQVKYIDTWKPGVDQSFFSWMPLTLPVVTDGTVKNFEYLLKTGNMVALSGRYREPGSEQWIRATIMFRLNGTMQGVLSQAPGSSAMAEVTVPFGSEFQPIRYRVTTDGELKPEVPNYVYTWGENGLSWLEEAPPSGSYNLGFSVTAFGGKNGFDSVTIPINNDSIDPKWRGYVDPFLGLAFQHPSNFTPVADFGDRLSSVNLATDDSVNIYYFKPSQTDMFSIIQEAGRRYTFRMDNIVAEGTLDGRPITEFELRYRLGNGNIVRGRAFATTIETAQGVVAIIASADTVADTALQAEMYERLRFRLDFFGTTTEQVGAATTWRYRVYDNVIAHPVRSDWQAADDGDTLWLSYTLDGDPNSLSRASLASFPISEVESAFEVILGGYSQEAEGFELLTVRDYFAEAHTWKSASYNLTRNGQVITGRLHVAVFNNAAYAMRLETPAGDDAPQTFRSLFELMVDGFTPPRSPASVTTDAYASFLKAATLVATEVCAETEANEACLGGGTATPVPGTLTDVGGTISLADMQQISVGLTDATTVDPFSIALLKIQPTALITTNQPLITLTAFGGATIINTGTSATAFPASNSSGDDLNHYAEPSIDSTSGGFLLPETLVVAVGRTEDSRFVRVELPDQFGMTAWVEASGLTLEGDLASLPISNPAQPYYAPMHQFEVHVDADGIFTQTALNGILITVPPQITTAYFDINHSAYELTGGTTVFWAGENLAEITGAAVAATEDAAEAVINSRRPEAWSVSVVQGAARVAITDQSFAWRKVSGYAMYQTVSFEMTLPALTRMQCTPLQQPCELSVINPTSAQFGLLQAIGAAAPIVPASDGSGEGFTLTGEDGDLFIPQSAADFYATYRAGGNNSPGNPYKPGNSPSAYARYGTAPALMYANLPGSLPTGIPATPILNPRMLQAIQPQLNAAPLADVNTLADTLLDDPGHVDKPDNHYAYRTAVTPGQLIGEGGAILNRDSTALDRSVRRTLPPPLPPAPPPGQVAPAGGTPEPEGTLEPPPAAEGDSDGDGVPDALDACPSAYDYGGGLTSSGCPLALPLATGEATPPVGDSSDPDGDGVRYSGDLCPNEYAPGTTYGCSDPSITPGGFSSMPTPDTSDPDSDGIVAPFDLCPFYYSPSDPDGCPLAPTAEPAPFVPAPTSAP